MLPNTTGSRLARTAPRNVPGLRNEIDRLFADFFERPSGDFGRFSRGFSLPASIEADEVEARFDEGLLRVTLPKAAEARTRKIEVDVS